MVSLYQDYKRRALLVIMSVLITILVIVNVVTYSVSKKVIERQFGLAAESVAVTISLVIREDLNQYREFLKTRDITSEYYERMQNYFAAIKRTSNIRFIYTMSRLNDTQIEYILDAEPVGSRDYSAPGTVAEMREATRQVFLTKQPAIRQPTRSDFGVLLGGCAPIIDEHGDLLGVVAVSIDHSMVFLAVQQLFIVLCIICTVLLIVIYFLLSKVSHFFLELLLNDKLTKAYNKRYFESLLQRSIDVALKEEQDLSLLMLDLDHFKNVNDTYGHPFGDIVLSRVSSLVRDCLRKDDFFVRFGGEEFVVLLFDLDSSIAIMLAERIRRIIESYEIYNEEKNVSVKITISIGVASLDKKKISALDFVGNADKALYKAKETRNTVAKLPD